MNKLSIFTIKALRKLYAKTFNVQPISKPECEQDPDVVSRIIYDKLMDDQPCMIARFGAFELQTLVNYLGVKYSDKSISQYVKGESLQWWWNLDLLNSMKNNAGFFPINEVKIEQFCELMLADIKEVDVLGSWLTNESYLNKIVNFKHSVFLLYLEPFFSKMPWSLSLKGKKVLVVHPYANLIEEQFLKKNDLFKDENILPDFQLKTIQAVQSIGGANSRFNDWFEALEWMKNEIDKMEYDICIIGCGAYGFHLAAHVKRTGKKSIHLGGSLQLLFGIKGSRWENSKYASEVFKKEGVYVEMFNKYWIKPGDEYRPANYKKVENGCYW